MTCFRSCVAAFLLTGSLAAFAADKTVAITYYIDHPSSAAVLKGVMDGLHKDGIDEQHGYKFDVQGAQGSPVTAAQIAQKFAAEDPAVIVALSSSSAQAILSKVTTTPVVFAGITNPVAAKLVNDMQHPGKNATGTKDSPPLSELVDLVRQVKPGLTKLGVIYNPGDAGSSSQVAELRSVLAGTKISLIETTVTRATDIQTAAQSLASKVDVIFCPNDIMVVSSFPVLNRVQLEQKVPVVVTAPEFVRAGAVAGVGTSFYEGGVAAAGLVKKIIVDGKNPADLPVVLPRRVIVTVNPKSAEALGIHFSAGLLASAERVDASK